MTRRFSAAQFDSMASLCITKLKRSSVIRTHLMADAGRIQERGVDATLEGQQTFRPIKSHLTRTIQRLQIRALFDDVRVNVRYLKLCQRKRVRDADHSGPASVRQPQRRQRVLDAF